MAKIDPIVLKQLVDELDSDSDSTLSPAAVSLTFGKAVEATAIFSTGSSVTLMNVEFFEKIKALPNAEDIFIRSKRKTKSEFNYWSSAGLTKNEILGAVSLHAVLNGVPVVIRFHLVKDSVADALLGRDFMTSLSTSTITWDYFEWRHGLKIVRTYFLKKPKFRNHKEGGDSYKIVSAVNAYV